jgi:hypothetical protein
MPQVRDGERGRIIDTVADHGNAFSLALQIRDLRRFVCWQHLGDYGVDAELVGDAACRRLVVSGRHDDLDVHGVQFAYCRRRGVAGSVCQGENSHGSSDDRDEDGCTPGGGEFVSAAPHDTQVDAFGGQEAAVAYQYSVAIDLPEPQGRARCGTPWSPVSGLAPRRHGAQQPQRADALIRVPLRRRLPNS